MFRRELQILGCVLALWLSGPVAASEGSNPSPQRSQPPLRLVISAELEVPDPHHRAWFAVDSLFSSVYEKLLNIDADGRLGPHLAESWTRVDPLTYRFKIRPGVRFHDGSECTSRDIVFSLQRAQDFPDGEQKARLAGVAKVRAIDAETVEVTSLAPDPLLLRKLSFILVVPEDSPTPIVHPVGTGPYRWVKSPKPNRVLLQAFDGYWAEPAPEPRVEFWLVEDPDKQLALFDAGEVDLIPVAPDSAPELERRDDLWIFSRLGPGITHLTFQSNRPPFDDVRLRRAVHLALDRDQIVHKAFRGYARAAADLAGPGSVGFDANRQPTKRNLDQARTLLREAGFPEGFEFSLDTNTRRAPLAREIARQLSEVGIRVKAQTYPWPELIDRLGNGSSQAHLLGWGNIIHDLGDVFDHLTHTRDPERRLGLHNESRFSNPDLDRLIEASSSTLDESERIALLHKISAQVANDAVVLPLVWTLNLWAGTKELQWSPRSDGLLNPYDMYRKP